MPSEVEDRLQKAIMDVLADEGWLKEGEALGDFIVMAEITSWGEQTGRTRYANLLPPSEMPIPIHRIVGLVEVCSDLLVPADDE